MKKQIARRSAVGITYKNQIVLVNTEETDAYAQDLARIFGFPRKKAAWDARMPCLSTVALPRRCL